MNSLLLFAVPVLIGLASVSGNGAVHLQSFKQACEASLSQEFSNLNATERWLAAMEILERRRDLFDGDALVDWFEALESGSLLNPIREKTSSTEGTLWFRFFERMREEGNLDIDQMKSAAREFVGRRNEIEEKRRRVANGSEPITRLASFIDVDVRASAVGLNLPPGVSFKEDGVDYSLEIMQTPVTQWMWAAIMGKNPAHATKDGVELPVGGGRILMQSDHPVDSVSPAEIVEFLQVLNSKKTSEGLIRTIIPSHRFGDTYSVPNLKLYNLIVKKCRVSESIFQQDRKETQLRDYAWYSENSSWTSHEVASLKPILIAGHPIFDFLGNVQEIGVENWSVQWKGKASDASLVLRGFLYGGGFKDDEQFFQTLQIDGGGWDLNYKWGYTTMGLRLVRLRRIQNAK